MTLMTVPLSIFSDFPYYAVLQRSLEAGRKKLVIDLKSTVPFKTNEIVYSIKVLLRYKQYKDRYSQLPPIDSTTIKFVSAMADFFMVEDNVTEILQNWQRGSCARSFIASWDWGMY
jgi:hypothetical protein